MQAALEFYEAVPREVPGLVRKLRAWLRRIPDRLPSYDPDGAHLRSCHVVCRAAKAVFGLHDWTVVDGTFARPGQEHAWLAREYRGGMIILDVYPVAGVGGPLMVDACSPGSPWVKLYKPDPKRYADRIREFDAEANEIADA